MRKALLPLISIPFVFLYCKESSVSTSRAISFYDSVNNQINITRPPIQNLIDKITAATFKLTEDSLAVIDTTTLLLCLDSARQMNEVRLSTINIITEVDNQINYKQRVLSSERILKELLDHEFPQCIEIFGETGKNRYRSSDLILPKLQKLKEALNDVEAAKTEFKSKYKFTAPEE